MVLKIDYEVFKLVSVETETYYFDPDTYLIVDKTSNEAKFVEYPISFPFTAKYEAERAFIQTLNKTLRQFFDRIKDEKEFENWFWGTVDDGGQNLRDFRIFEDRYQLKKITDWCEENNIAYYVDKSDWYIKKFIGE